jgi:hypothetical protein
MVVHPLESITYNLLVDNIPSHQSARIIKLTLIPCFRLLVEPYSLLYSFLIIIGVLRGLRLSIPFTHKMATTTTATSTAAGAASSEVTSIATLINDNDNGNGASISSLNGKRKVNGKRKMKKDKLQQLLMDLEVIKGWSSDIMPLVVDYCIDNERLLIMCYIEDGYHTLRYETATFWSLSVESLYHIVTNNNDGDRNDIKWLYHGAHPQYGVAPLQFYSVVMMYDHDRDRIIVTGADSNSFINWNDIQNSSNTVTSSSSTNNNSNDNKSASTNVSIPKNDSLFHSLSSMPTSRHCMLHTLLSHESIKLGGYKNNKVEVYNMKTDKWSSLPDLIPHQHGRSARDAACDVDPRNGRIYIFGGGVQNYIDVEAENTVDYYDPITNKWSTLSVKMKRKRFSPSAIWLPTINSFLITGGYPTRLELRYQNDDSRYQEDDYDPIDGQLCEERQSMEIYSPDTNTFTLLPWSIPEEHRCFSYHRLHLIDDRFLIFTYQSPQVLPPPGTNRL